MMLAGLQFASPWALAALGTLPLLWLILRASPPAPVRQVFPPLRLLLGLRTPDEARSKAPLWLIILRMTILALAIIGLARPSLSAPARANEASGGRVLIAIDDSWTLAPHWASARAAVQSLAAELEQEGGEAHLLLTTPSARPWSAAQAMTPAGLRGRLAQLEPQPWRADRGEAAGRLEAARLSGVDRVVWITDGLAAPGDEAFVAALQQLAPVSVRTPDGGPRAIVDAVATAEGVRVAAVRGPLAPNRVAIAAETADGRSLGVTALQFAGGRAEGLIALPAEIAARAAQVRVVGEDSAGAIRLIPEGSSRPLVGLVSPGEASQPLLSELYYVDRALQPFATLRRGGLAELIADRAQAIVLPDASRIAPEEARRLLQWLEDGGLLIRFAGPRLANDADEFVPVPLRGGSRALGASLSWEQPLAIAPFASDSPFAGLVAPADVLVRRQLLAAPGPAVEDAVWARLTDDSPLVTAAARGSGLIVLFHVSGGPEWSDLPLSGLYVQMLRRVAAFAGRGGEAQAEVTGTGPFRARQALDGFGNLREVRATPALIPAESFPGSRAGPDTPPGLYERAGLLGAVQAAAQDEALSPLALPQGWRADRLNAAAPQPLAGLFLGLAALLAIADLVVSLFLAGRLPRLLRGAAAFAVIGLAVQAAPAHAQLAPDEDATLTLRLAYVVTGDAATDRLSRQGLTVLSQTLFARTAVEPASPLGVNLSRDDLSVFPFIYWPAPNTPTPLSGDGLANLSRYLRLGGMLLVDTRDAGVSPSPGDGPAARMLRGLDAPPLERVSTEHVVARSFYLLRGFPGGYGAPQLWAESQASAAARDGVPSLFVGDGDWAAAWAGEANVVPRQRELSLRFGVNLIMVALTGNYKADQVHVPALLQRLGDERRR
jgi:Domain of unknown function (DUF4159)/Aerotolerance regulator N-terminal